MKTFFLTNGILDFSDCIEGWNDEGADWINSHTDHHARSYQYAAAIFHNVWKASRVKKFLTLISRYGSVEKILVGHSDGCDVICRILQHKLFKFEDIHLFAAACEADFNKNGLNKAVEKGKVKRIFVYGSKDDKALQKAKKNDWWLRLMGQQYGNPPLGLSGPINMSVKAALVTKILMIDGKDHSQWFHPKLHLIESMQSVINA